MSAPWDRTRYPHSFAGVGFDSVEVVDCDALPPAAVRSCAFCPFPCPPDDALPVAGGGVAHATCAFEAQRTAYLAGLTSIEGGR